MEFMPVHFKAAYDGKNWFIVWCRKKICNLTLCHAQSFISEASIEGNHPQSILWKSLKNDHVAATVNSKKDEVFWKAIYCLLHAIFPALKALRYCNSNIPAMDKIFFLVKGLDEALLIHSCLMMTRIYLGLWGDWFYLTARKNWMKSSEKQIQKGMMSC